jgi:hypothetical protein
VPRSLRKTLKVSPSERKWAVVPSIDFRNTSRSACCSALSVSPIVLPVAGSGCSGNTSARVWAWPRRRCGSRAAGLACAKLTPLRASQGDN